MEIRFEELDTRNPYAEYEDETTKYWEQQPTQTQKQTKKKVSFDDILSNMNLVVNKSGVLQFMQPQLSPIMETNEYSEQEQYYNDPYMQTNAPPMYVNKVENTPIAPAVKHSYIYNKYFKDYQDASPQEPTIRVPKTMEEYRQMLLDDKRKAYEERKRISEIKSTKLLFTSNEGVQYRRPPPNIRASHNGLRKMSFY